MAKYKSDQKLKYTEENEIVNFGHLKGKTIGEIIEKEPGFIEWARRTCKPKFQLSVKLIKKFNLDPKTYVKL